ncbi:hypothetical protein L208DRAFT_1286026, partial [Tricholoma matsutake]
WHPPNPYYSIHCMHLIDCIIWYSVAYLCVLSANWWQPGDIHIKQYEALYLGVKLHIV